MLHLTKKLFGLKLYVGLENVHYMLRNEGDFVQEPHFKHLVKANPGDVLWDVGSSLGIYSMFAASFPWKYKVIAFELSPRAAELSTRSIRENGLDRSITVVARPLVATQMFYKKPLTAHQENKVTPGHEFAMDLREALQNFGVPKVIKMDIEGMEVDFLNSDEFVGLINDNNITLFIECHSKAAEDQCRSRLDMRNLISGDQYANHYYKLAQHSGCSVALV